MKNIYRKILIVISVTTMISCSLVFPERETYTPEIINDSGDIVAGSISSLEYVELNGIEQSICIRGYSTENPVLLLLHGGPGFGLTGWRERFITDELEKNFTVVLWDQRGAGRSFNGDLGKDDLSIDILVDDTYSLINYLRERFNKDKIYLMGHSWGSGLGFLTMMKYQDYPDLIEAYISAGEAVDLVRRHEKSFEWTLEQAYLNENNKAIRQLERLLPFDPTNSKSISKKNKWQDEFGGQVADKDEWDRIKEMGGNTPEYSPADMLKWMRGMAFSSRILSDKIAESNYNLIEQFPKCEIPIYFFIGNKDFTTPGVYVEEYSSIVDVPDIELFYFENAHFSFIIEEELFTEYMLQIKERVEKL